MIQIFLTAGTVPPEDVKTLWEILFTEQLPATLTFISALLGIISQLVLNNLSNFQKNKAEKEKNRIDSVRKFYIPIFYLLSEYKVNLDILKAIDKFDLYDSSNLNSYQSEINAIYEIIEKLANYTLEDYYPINAKTNKKMHEMFINMELSNKVLKLPLSKRKETYSLYRLPPTGYDASELIELINKITK